MASNTPLLHAAIDQLVGKGSESGEPLETSDFSSWQVHVTSRGPRGRALLMCGHRQVELNLDAAVHRATAAPCS
jgi:hypothetical protein